MLKLQKIAVTGGVASGKTTVCKLFQELGAYVVNADAIVHELLNPKTEFGQQVIRLLGPDIVENGKINRSVVAEKVFKNSQKLRELETILHPAVLAQIERLYKKATGATLFVVEIPLLFEIGAETNYDAVIAVVTDEALAKKRFTASGHTTQEYERRMSRQLSQHIKSAKADYTILNNGTLQDLSSQVKKLYAHLTKE
jgi:dephospho-CoA kinase